MNGIPKIVISKTLKTADWNNTTLISENAAAEIKKLKKQDGKDMYVLAVQTSLKLYKLRIF